MLVTQIKAGGTVTVGNMTWTVKPDVYLAGFNAVKTHVADGLLQGPAVPYATNVLEIMVPKGNPAHVTGLADLGRDDIRSEEHTSELQSLMRISYAVFCLKKKTNENKY